MTPAEFRRLALAFPGAEESAHRGHPDFRREGRIFATLSYPDEHWGMVKLLPEEQDNLLRAQVDVFTPSTGAWGRQGSTLVRLEKAEAAAVERALRLAWDGAKTKRKKQRVRQTP